MIFKLEALQKRIIEINKQIKDYLIKSCWLANKKNQVLKIGINVKEYLAKRHRCLKVIL